MVRETDPRADREAEKAKLLAFVEKSLQAAIFPADVYVRAAHSHTDIAINALGWTFDLAAREGYLDTEGVHRSYDEMREYVNVLATETFGGRRG